jgi:dienelactone hydrolase
VSSEIEVHKGANHGWVPPDSQNHNAEAAERGWARKLATRRTAVGMAIILRRFRDRDFRREQQTRNRRRVLKRQARGIQQGSLHKSPSGVMPRQDDCQHTGAKNK